MSDKRLPVIIAVHSFGCGGAERAAVALANHWSDSRTRPVLLVARGEGAIRYEVAEHVEVVNLDVPTEVASTFRFFRRLRVVLGRIKPVCIISHLTSMNRAMLRMKILRTFTCPLVLVEHSNFTTFLNEAESKIVRLLVRVEVCILYRFASRIAAVSGGVARSIADEIGIALDRIAVVYNPVDIDHIRKMSVVMPGDPFAMKFLELPRPIVLGVGRLHPSKAFDDMIVAFSKLPSIFRGSLVILGDGDLLEELVRLGSECGVSNSLHTLGFVSNPWWYMANSDIFVLSSHWEGFGLVLVEAMVCGLPVVATDCPYGPSELVADGRTGRLTNVSQPDQLASVVAEELSITTSERECRVNMGRESAMRFDVREVVSVYLSLVESLTINNS